jgi:hypothetical protein
MVIVVTTKRIPLGGILQTKSRQSSSWATAQCRKRSSGCRGGAAKEAEDTSASEERRPRGRHDERDRPASRLHIIANTYA